MCNAKSTTEREGERESAKGGGWEDRKGGEERGQVEGREGELE